MKKLSFTSPIYEVEIKDGKIVEIDFLDILTENGISYEILVESNWDGVPEIKFTGTKDELIPLLTLFDPYSRGVDELKKVLKYWDGDENKLWEIYLY